MRASRPARASRWRFFDHPRVELLLILALFAVALAVRWPYLLRLPHFTDEVNEVRLSLSIARGETFPLMPKDKYFGPLHTYLVAACLWLVGPSMVLPRAVVMVIGALTVVATYLLGRELAGRGVGALGAALLATAPQHVIVNSHVAWQNSTTPLYSTLCCWALARALRRADLPEGRWGRGGRWLVLAGGLYGLVLQTHPGTILLAPALAGTVLYRCWTRRAGGDRRAWRLLSAAKGRRPPWPVSALAAALLTYSPVLIYNLEHGLAGVTRVQTRREYAYVSNPTLDSYGHNLGNLLLELARMVSNPTWLPERPAQYLTSPYLLIAAGLCLAGLVLLLRRGEPLPLFAFAATVAVMPYVNKAYGQTGDRFMLTGRYVAYLQPLAAIAIAVAALALAGAGLRALQRLPRRWRRWQEAAVAVPVVLIAALVLYPLLPLGRYYRAEAARDPANASFLETVRVVNAHRGPRTSIWVDRYFDKIDQKDGATALNIIDYLLILDGVPHQLVDDPGDELRRAIPTLDPNDPESFPIVIMPRDRCWPLRDELPLQRLSDTLILNELYRYYGVYRYTPSQPGRCLPPDQAGG